MALFGPPDTEKMKIRRDLKGLVGALKYQRSSQVRKNAAAALAELATTMSPDSMEGAVLPLIAALEDNDSAVVTMVVQALSVIGRPAVLPLISALRAAKEGTREGAARALGRLANSLSDPANLNLAVDPLVAHLREPSIPIRRTAALTLGRIGQRLDPAQRRLPTDTLILCLRDSSPEVREAAVYSLSRMGEGRAVRPMIGMLEDPGSSVRKGASEALTALGWQPTTPEELASYRVARQNWEAAVSAGSSAISALVRVAKDSDTSTRLAAVQALGKTGSPETVLPLVEALKDQDGGVRAAAAEALEKVGASHAVEPLLLAIRDPDRYVRSTVARALSFTQDARAVAPLINLLRSHEHEIVEAAVQALTRLGHLAIPQLIGLLSETSQFLIDPAMKTLVKIGADSVQPLIQLMQEGFPPANKFAAQLLGEIKDLRAVRPLIASLADLDLAAPAAIVLGKIGDSRAVKPLLEALKSPADPIQQAAAQALGLIGDPAAVDPLINLLRSTERQVRSDAAKALLAMYRSKKLDVVSKRKILEQRERITTRHNDAGLHQDENRFDWHMDHIVHDDTGIGLDFPNDPY